MNKKRKKSKKRTIILSVLSAVIVLSCFSIVFLLHGLNGMTVSGEDLPENLDKPAPDRLNLLLIGTDKSGANTDVLMLASWDKDDNQLKFCSIPRDTRVYVKNKAWKINACMALGKDDLLLKTVKDITGAPINYYIKVDTSGFRNIVDILGGVDFYVPRDMYYPDPAQDLYIDLKEGMQHLDGDHAEQLVRFRRYAMGDIQRVKVQQDFMKALIEQNLNAELIVKAPSLYNEVSKYVKTNLSASSALKNIGILNALVPENKDKDGGKLDFYKEDRRDKIITFTLPGTARNINGLSYYVFNPDETFDLMRTHFGGSGSSSKKSTYQNEYNKAVSGKYDSKKPSSTAPKDELSETETDKPKQPDIPDVPETPELPDVPDAPELPDVPETPDIPDVPDIPDTPEPPADPELPDVPEEPVTPPYFTE